MPSHPSPAAHGVRRWSTAFRRRPHVVLLGLLIGLLAGWAMLRTTASSGPATATVDLDLRAVLGAPTDDGPRGDAQLTASRVAARLSAEETLAAAAADHGSPLPLEVLSNRLTATAAPPDGVVLTVTHEDAATARGAAEAVVAAYVAWERDALAAARDERVAELTAALNEASRERSAAERQLSTSDDAERRAVLAAARDDAAARSGELSDALDDLQTRRPGGTVVEDSTVVRAAPEASRRVLAAVVPALLGLALGAAAAIWWDRRDVRLWDASELSSATAAAEVVHVPRGDLTGDGLRTGASHRRLHELVTTVPGASVLVTGPSTTHAAGVAVGLAVATASSGRRTLLLDASGADAFGLHGGDVDGWLTGRTGLDRAARSPDGMTALQVLRGTPTSDLASSEELRELLHSRHAQVVLHVPGGATSRDALALAELVDAVVVVAAARRDDRKDVSRAERWLARSAAGDPVVVLAG